MPVAVSCCVPVLEITATFGAIATAANVGAPTVSEPETVADPLTAAIVEVPCATAVTNPAMVTVATVVVPDDQVTRDVTSCVELSLYVPVAWYCWLVPDARLAVAGVIEMDTSAGPDTVTPVEALHVP